MFTSSTRPERRRRRRIALALAVAMSALLACAYVALSPASRPRAESGPATSWPPSDRVIATGRAGAVPALPSLAGTTDPDAFADAVAHALFDWDTARPLALREYADPLLEVADPTGTESAGLAADVSAYLPTEEAWAYLKPYYTRQWIEIESIAVPDLWEQAVVEAGPGGFAPGTAAYTIEGVRHRAGVWEGDEASSAHDVRFTVFIVCRPAYPSCHLLRLSRLNEPLE